MSDFEKVVSYTRRLERLLRDKYHATGDDLLQLTESCDSRIPHNATQKLYYIIKIEQQLLGNEDYRLEDRAGFFRVCIECERELTPRGGRFVWGMVIFLVAVITVAALLFYMAHWDMLTKRF